MRRYCIWRRLWGQKILLFRCCEVVSWRVDLRGNSGQKCNDLASIFALDVNYFLAIIPDYILLLETIQLIGHIFKNSVLQHWWLFELQSQFLDFPPKLYQLVAESILTCNKKSKWVLMYLIFLYNLTKFLSHMLSFNRPTSIIAFGGKSEELRLKFKEPPMLEYTVSKNTTDKLNAL